MADDDMVPERVLHILAETSLSLELKIPEVEQEQKLSVLPYDACADSKSCTVIPTAIFTLLLFVLFF